MPLYSMILTAAATITINTARVVGTGTLTLPNANAAFAGNNAWTFANVTNTALSASRTTTFQVGQEYIITTNLTTEATDLIGEKHTWQSSSADQLALITLQYGATQDAAWINATDIDSRNGQAIYTFRGVIDGCYNWSNSIGAGGRLILTAGGETVAVADVTKDNAGVALGSCKVYVFRDNGNNTATFMGYVLSDSVTGAYSLSTFPGDSYFAVALKAGATPVKGATYLISAA
jgi:hypothetical protein